MELPAALRQAVDATLAHVPLAQLSDAARTLSERYRGEIRDDRLHISDDLAARAYLATRLPATYAAMSAAFDAVAEMRPEFAPHSLLDLGAGPGTAMWAATRIWPVADALLVERSGAIRSVGETLSAGAGVEKVVWNDSDLTRDVPEGRRDLVVIAYVLNELPPAAANRLLSEAWERCQDTLVVVEPGTPAGWRRILRVRELLLSAGGHVVAPCPHVATCPLSEPDWCHFSRKVARSRLHRLAKGADVPWEDEKFVYLAASRQPASRTIAGRVISPPKAASGRVSLKLCRSDGTAGERLVTRREGPAYKTARRLDWGDAWPAAARPAEQP